MMKIAVCLASTALILVVIALLCLKVYDEVKDYWVFIRLWEPSVIEPSNYSWYVSAAEEERYDITWTGDATTIVFSNRGGSGSRHLTNIYVVDANGTQLTRWIPERAPQDAKGELAYDSAPYVNPVTSKIVYATLRHGVYGFGARAYRGLQIATAELDGSDYRRLTESDSRDLNPAWSPDGTRIAFVSNRGDRYFRVYIMDADGSNVVEAAPYGATRPERPLWSPDGFRLAFRLQGHLYTAPAVGGGAQGVGSPTTLDGLTWTDPAWSPDGEWLAFSHREPLPEWPMQSETISMVRPGFTAEPDASASRKVIRLARVDGGSMQLDNLSWAPDGATLRFTAFLGENAHAYALYQVLTDGSGLTEITKVERRSRMAWSPDGSRVAVVDGRIGSSRDGLVYTMAPDGSDKRAIVVEGPYGPAAANGG